MKSSRLLLALGVVIAAQFFILTAMVATAAMPLWRGTEIRVKTIPVDPRSMFRGNYARLAYTITQLPDNALAAESAFPLRKGEVVYVSLKQDQNGLYEFATAALERPEQGVFLRGRISNNYLPYRVKYGIEAFFAPKKKALQLETDLRGGGVAILMVTDSGKVALKDVVPESAAR